MNYRRKSYVSLNGLIGFISVFVIGFNYFNSFNWLVLFLTIHMATIAFNDTLADAIMAVEAKKDPLRGSEDLQSLSFFLFSSGGIIGSIIGAIFAEYVHPKWGMMLYSFFSLIMAIGAYRMKEKQTKLESGRCSHAASVLKATGKAISAPIIYKVLLFHFFAGAIIPRFPEFKYYFLIDELKFNQLQYGLLFMLSCVTLLFMVILFNWVFKRYSYRQGMAIAILITTITTFFDILLVLRVNLLLGIPDGVFLLVTNLFEDFVNTKYTAIANGVINVKIAPNAVEATVMALCTGVTAFGFGVIGNTFGAYMA